MTNHKGAVIQYINRSMINPAAPPEREVITLKTQTVHVGKNYNIYIESGIINSCGRYIREISKAEKAVIITDSNVAPLYGERVRSSLESAGFQTFTYVFKAGENSKRLSTVENILCFLSDCGISRDGLIIALGGGVAGDTAGLCAALYMRGVCFVQIPTSLLAQIDSSVGGKTAVDLEAGKNLCGAFWQPELVLIDPELLKTLPPKFFADGMGEAIKYGCIKDKNLFERLENENVEDFIEDMIHDCVSIKRAVVENDEKEKGERIILNFGHTLGHALEKYYNFEERTHGEAVGIGMILIAMAGEKNKITAPGTAARISKLLQKYNLPISDPAPLDELLKLCSADKKRCGDKINFVLLKEIGKAFVLPLEI